MKNKTCQPIAIGKNEAEEKRFKSQIRTKRRMINELYDICSKYVKIEDKSTLQGNFYNDFITLFLAKYQNEFPPISVNKMLEAMEVNIVKLESLCQSIQAIKIELDSNLEAPIPDFNIYTESEDQNKLYITLKRLCKDIASLKDFGIRITGAGLTHGTQQALMYDWSKQEMIPNTRKVLGKDIRF